MPLGWKRVWGLSALLVAALGASAVAAQPQTVMRLEPSSLVVQAEEGSFSVQVLADNVANLGAFQFTLVYDSGVLEVKEIERGPLLTSSGRTPYCEGPTGPAGATKFACVTLGASPPGATGSGVLASITLLPRGAGVSSLRLERALMGDVLGNRLPASVGEGSVTVVGGGGGVKWALWGPVIGGGALVLLAGGLVGRRRLRAWRH